MAVAAIVGRHQIAEFGMAVAAIVDQDTASHLDSTQMRSADRVEQCPSSKANRKTSTRDEYFAF